MASRRALRPHPPEEARDAALCRRAWRHRRRGEERRAFVVLRDAALEHDDDARLWALYGAQCARVGRLDEATRAFAHAVWLRERRREPGKAAATRALLDRLARSAA